MTGKYRVYYRQDDLINVGREFPCFWRMKTKRVINYTPGEFVNNLKEAKVAANRPNVLVCVHLPPFRWLDDAIYPKDI